MQAGFPTGTEPDAGTKKFRFRPPSIEELKPYFPQLEILNYIGQGGMGAVYKARQPMLDRYVALKILPPEAATGPGFTERFTREARALARLNHPNIVAVHEFGQSGGYHYLIMEFVDGVNLREMERTQRLLPAQALAIVPKICDALQYAHDEGVVHRDIKPENILVDKKGRVKIADFGIAKILGAETRDRLTGAQHVVGTPHYMAPEQVEKPLTVDHRADIYSVGVVFYEMLTGELPLGRFAAPSKKVQIDVRLDEVVLRALEKEPELRYQHASVLKSDVETISTPGIQPQSKVNRPRFSRTAILGLVGPIVFIALASAALRLPGEPPRIDGAPNFIFLIASPLLAMCIVGWAAISKIRRSAGTIYGMTLGFVEAMLLPLLALDGLIFLLCYLVAVAVHGEPDVSNREQALVYTTAIILSLIADLFVVRSAWRIVNRVPEHQPTRLTMPPDLGNAPRTSQSLFRNLLVLLRQFWKQIAATLLFLNFALPHTWEFNRFGVTQPWLFLPTGAHGIIFNPLSTSFLSGVAALFIAAMLLLSRNQTLKSRYFRWIGSVAIALVIAAAARLVIETFKVTNDAVAPEINPGSTVLVYKLSHKFQQGDIVAYRWYATGYPTKYLLGRVAEPPYNNSISIERRNQSPEKILVSDIVGKVIFNTRASSAADLAHSPQNLRDATTPQVIAAGLSAPKEPWAWQELQRRGGLSSAEGNEIVTGLTLWLQRNYPDGYREPLFWLGDYLKDLHANHLISSSNELAFLVAFVGNSSVEPLPRLRDNIDSLDFTAELRTPWWPKEFGFELLNYVTSVDIDGQHLPLKASYGNRWNQQYYRGELKSLKLTPGKHTLRYEVETAIVPMSEMPGLREDAPPGEWPAPAKRWKRTAERDFTVYPAGAEIVSLSDAPSLNPIAHGALSVEQILIRISKGKPTVVVAVKTDPQPSLPISVDVNVRIADQTVKCGNVYAVKETNGTTHFPPVLQAEIKPLSTAINEADVIFTPNPSAVEQFPNVTHIWGKPIVIPHLHVVRQDLSSRPLSNSTSVALDKFGVAIDQTVTDAIDLDTGKLNAGKWDEATSLLREGSNDESLLEPLEELAKKQTEHTVRNFFGPTSEIELPFQGKTLETVCLDFDTGQILNLPKNLTIERTFLAWSRWFLDTGADAYAENRKSGPVLWGEGCVFATEPDESWNSLDATNTFKDATNAAFMMEAEMKRSEFPKTFLFKTRQNGIGLLQLTGITADKRALQLRYKLVKNEANDATTKGP